MGAPGRAPAEHGAGVARYGRRSRLARRCPGPGPRVGVRAITRYRKMQREGLRDSEWHNIYFGSKRRLYNKCATGSSARAGSEARPGRERRRPVGGRRPVPSTGQNTVLPAHSGLRSPFTAEERVRSDSGQPERVGAVMMMMLNRESKVPVCQQQGMLADASPRWNFVFTTALELCFFSKLLRLSSTSPRCTLRPDPCPFPFTVSARRRR